MKENTIYNFAATDIIQDRHRQTRTHSYPNYSHNYHTFENYEKVSSNFKNTWSFILKITSLGSLNQAETFFGLGLKQHDFLVVSVSGLFFWDKKVVMTTHLDIFWFSLLKQSCKSTWGPLGELTSWKQTYLSRLHETIMQ